MEAPQSEFEAKLSWLARPLTCGRATALAPLDLARLCDDDLKDISLRMETIMETIEMPRCEGRLIPRGIFDQMCTLEDRIFDGPKPRLSDWLGLIARFGEYYHLGGCGPIPVDFAIFEEYWARYSKLSGFG